MICKIDHDALLLANQGKFTVLQCPDCREVIEVNPALSVRQREIAIRKQYESMLNQQPVIVQQTMSDDEMARIHALIITGSYVKARS